MKRRRGAAAIVAIALALVVAVAGAADAETANLGFDFDDGPDRPSVDGGWDSGCFGTGPGRGCVQTSGNAVLRSVPRGDGSALRFPDEGSAVIQVTHAEVFNPGLADFTISALVRLAPGQFKAGANVIQKGMYDSAHGQWKLQVDSGVPSCRVSGGTAEVSFATAEARARGKLKPNVWTSIQCVRDGSRLRLFVAGAKAAWAEDADVDIDNRDPVLIGGKHAGGGNDQFRSDLDDVAVAIEEEPPPSDERPSGGPGATPGDERPSTGPGVVPDDERPLGPVAPSGAATDAPPGDGQPVAGPDAPSGQDAAVPRP